MRHRYIIETLLTLILLMGCASHKSEVATIPEQGNIWGVDRKKTAVVMPSVIIYKTRADYHNHVPVMMDASYSRIVSYPDPVDLCRNDGSLRTPTQLNKGYLLDNKGVNAHTVFLDYTYDEYVALDTIPSTDELMQHIVDKYPFVEMWDCGQASKFRDRVVELNHLIDNNLPGCRNIIYRY